MAHLPPLPGQQVNQPLCPQCQNKSDGLKEVMLWLSLYLGQNRCPHQGPQGPAPGQNSCPFLALLREKNTETYGRYHP